MMSAEMNYRGRTYKIVAVTGFTTQTDAEIIAFAMRYAGENESSLFGWNLRRDNLDPTIAYVMLHTD